MKRKVFALAMAVVMLGSVALTGCAGTAPASSSSPPASGEGAGSGDAALEPITFTMMYRDSPNYPFDPEWPALKAIQEEQNVTLDIRTVPSKDYASKVRIILSSGDIPDIVSGVDKDIITEYSSSGVLLRISDYLDKMPNLKAKIEQYDIADELDNWYTKDGGLYALPFMNESLMYNTAPAIRMDVLEEYGLEVPTTYDELYEVLKTIKEKRPDTYPMSNYNGAKNIRDISGASWGIEGSYNGFMYDESKGGFYYATITDEYKEYTKFLSKLVAEKIADPEIYTGTVDQWRQKVVSDNCVFCYTWISELAQINIDGKALNGEDFQMSPIAPLAGPGGQKASAGGRISQGTVLPASVADKPYFDRLLAFVDWMCYSDEGTTYTTWGIEGDTFEVKDGQKVFTDKVLNGDTGIQQSLWNIGASNNNFTLIFPYDWFVKVLNVPEVETMTEEARANGWFPDAAKVPKLDFAQQEQEKLLLATLNDYVAQMHEQFVYGKLDVDANWDQYVAEVHAKGLDDLLALYNAA